MRQSAKTAIGGMTAALSVVLMLLTAIPFFTYAIPAFAGALVLLIIIEINKKWAFGVYVAVSVISYFVAFDKEAAVMYAAFFGYYPIVKALLESKLPRVAEYIVKFALFNGATVSAYAFMIKFMGLSLTELTEFPSFPTLTKYGLPILLVMGNIMFAVYDLCLTRFVAMYIYKWQARFRRLFK